MYLYGPGGLDDLVAMMLENGTTPGLDPASEGFFAYTDAQDSVIALTPLTSSTPVERYAYAPFGAPSIYAPDGTTERTSSAVNNTRLYTGRPWNADLGLYDCRMRHYDPALGRFISPDPIGAYGDWNNLGNPYAYVGNNPGAFTDPLGLQSGLPEDIDQMLGYGTARPMHPHLLSVGSGNNPVANATRPIAERVAAVYCGPLHLDVPNPADATSQYLKVGSEFLEEELVGWLIGVGVVDEIAVPAVRRFHGSYSPARMTRRALPTESSGMADSRTNSATRSRE